MFITFLLFAITAFFEILGCYSVLQAVQGNHPMWFILLAIVSLALFAFLLTLHSTAPGRIYAAYGGVYMLCSLLWLWLLDGATPTTTDVVGISLTIVGCLVIASSFARTI